MPDDTLSGVHWDLPRLLVGNYFIIASSALIWIDFGLTFTTEVQCIWRRTFSGATIVFLFVRYAVLIDRFLLVVEVMGWNLSSLSDQTRRRIEHTDNVALIINYLAIAALTTLCVYGLWGRDWKPLLIVVPLNFTKPILYVVESVRYFPTSVQAGSSLDYIYAYTLPDGTPAKFSIIERAAVIASDVIVVGLIWTKMFWIKKDSSKIGVSTPLATLLLHNGIAYLIILLTHILTIVPYDTGSSMTVWLVWPYFDQVLTVIFLSRFILDLRILYHPTRAGDGATTLSMPPGFSDIRFAISTAVGKLGRATFSFISSDTEELETPRDSDLAAITESDREMEIEIVEREFVV